MLKKIVLSGGFHDVASITIAVAPAIYDALKRGDVSLTDYHVLSAAQQRKLSAHFCGIRSCKCGGYARARIEY